jgi:sedoheptulokinase
MELRPFLGQGYLHVGATLTAGKAYEELQRLFSSVITSCGFSVDDETVFSMMKRMGEQVTSEDALPVDTRFAGTRHDPLVRGSIGTIGLDNLRVGNLVRGTVDGIIDELHSFVAMQSKHLESLVAIGSSVRHNALFREGLKRFFGVVPIVPDVSDGAGLGAALIGAVSVGAISLTDVRAVVEKIAYSRA